MRWKSRSRRLPTARGMILVDTNILSTLAKVDRLDLLLRLFAPEEVGLVPAVYEEV